MLDFLKIALLCIGVVIAVGVVAFVIGKFYTAGCLRALRKFKPDSEERTKENNE